MGFYGAFISYSHGNDKPLAAALQSVAQKLGKPWYGRRATRIFRDDASLSATPHLWPMIEQALNQSKLFILLASPEAARSNWVNKEVDFWLENKGIDSLLIGLTSGELSWDDKNNDFSQHEAANPLPQALRGKFTYEPRWVDLRLFRDGVGFNSPKFIEASAEFAAAIHGVPKQDLLSLEVRQQRRALIWAYSGLALLLTLAFAAGSFALVAHTAERRAISNYTAAQKAADELVRSIAGQLRQQKGVSTNTLDIAFNSVDQLIWRMEQAVGQQDLSFVRALRSGFIRMEYLFGTPVIQDEMTTLEMSRAALLYEFAETYHQSAGDIGAARAKAEESLSIRIRLWRAGNDTPDLEEQIATTEMELGDLARQATERAKSAGTDDWPDYSSARKAYEAALGFLEPLVSRFPERVGSARQYGRLLTRLGDLDVKAGDRPSANRRYSLFLSVAERTFRRTPNDVEAIREVGWGFRKLGESQTDPAAAAAYFANEVCLHRRLVVDEPSNALWARDLGYGLTKLGGAKMGLKPPDLQGAEDAYFEALHLRLQTARTNFDSGSLRDFADALVHAAEVRRAGGDEVAANYYAAAAADVRSRLKEAFPEALPTEPSLRAAAERIAAVRREQGVLALIKAPSIELEDDDREFEVARLGEIERNGRICWNALLQTIESQPLAGSTH
jgi:MTH538 TIR-like domain (DUF1863)